MKIRSRIRPRITLLRAGRWLHAWVNVSKSGWSLSVKLLRRATWNSRTGTVSVDGPGVLNFAVEPDRNGAGR